jgi:hypothetical protein
MFTAGRQDLMRLCRPDRAVNREHAKRGGFTADPIHKVERVTDPTTAEAAA